MANTNMKIDHAQENNLNNIRRLMDVLKEQERQILSGGKMDMCFDYWLPIDLESIMESVIDNNDYDITEEQQQQIITDFCSANSDGFDANNPLSWDDISDYFDEKINELF